MLAVKSREKDSIPFYGNRVFSFILKPNFMGTSDSDSPYSGGGRRMSHVGVGSVTAEKKPGHPVGYTLVVYKSI